jgi:Holliday junction resolvasome RuvABC ATP-dependent DNA helicase subunit
MKNFFENTSLIGQTAAKNRLNFYLNGYSNSKVFPNMIFVAPKGIGKTHFATHVGKLLSTICGETKHFLCINSSSIKNFNRFAEDIYFNYINDKHVTLFFDEIHECNEKIITAFLSILNPTSINRNVYQHEDSILEFNFKKFTFMAATTERHKVFPPLLDRLTEINLEDYTEDEIAKIIEQNLPQDMIATKDALTLLSHYCRNTARQAAKLGGKEGISNFLACKQKKIFTLSDAKELIEILGLYPNGLTVLEINALKLIKDKDNVSSTYLSNSMGLSRESYQNIEGFLMKHHLISIENCKRSITDKGKKYLKNINK